MSFISMTNSSMTSMSLWTCSCGTFSDVSIFIFHGCGAISLKAHMNLLLNDGSPPPNVIPPPVAWKYRSSTRTRFRSCCGVMVMNVEPSRHVCGLRHQRHRSGHEWKTTSVVTPSQSVAMRWRETAETGACMCPLSIMSNTSMQRCIFSSLCCTDVEIFLRNE